MQEHQTQNIEDTMNKFVQISLNNQNNTCVSIKNLGMQMGQLVKEPANNQKGVFRAKNRTIQNSIVM